MKMGKITSTSCTSCKASTTVVTWCIASVCRLVAAQFALLEQMTSTDVPSSGVSSMSSSGQQQVLAAAELPGPQHQQKSGQSPSGPLSKAGDHVDGGGSCHNVKERLALAVAAVADGQRRSVSQSQLMVNSHSISSVAALARAASAADAVCSRHLALLSSPHRPCSSSQITCGSEHIHKAPSPHACAAEALAAGAAVGSSAGNRALGQVLPGHSLGTAAVAAIEQLLQAPPASSRPSLSSRPGSFSSKNQDSNRCARDVFCATGHAGCGAAGQLAAVAASADGNTQQHLAATSAPGSISTSARSSRQQLDREYSQPLDAPLFDFSKHGPPAMADSRSNAQLGAQGSTSSTVQQQLAGLSNHRTSKWSLFASESNNAGFATVEQPTRQLPSSGVASRCDMVSPVPDDAPKSLLAGRALIAPAPAGISALVADFCDADNTGRSSSLADGLVDPTSSMWHSSGSVGSSNSGSCTSSGSSGDGARPNAVESLKAMRAANKVEELRRHEAELEQARKWVVQECCGQLF